MTQTTRQPSRVTDADVLTIWRRMECRSLLVRVAKAKFRVGQHVRISNEKMKFAKATEHNYCTEIFRIVNVIHWRTRGVNELGDPNGTRIYGQFYSE
jgi:hypothetical protein